jgi:hypothetical protein
MAIQKNGGTILMSSDATTTNKSQPFPPPPKAQTAKDVMAANVKLLIEQLEGGYSEGLTLTSLQWAVSVTTTRNRTAETERGEGL